MRAVVNYITRGGWYEQGQARLLRSLPLFPRDITPMLFRDGDGRVGGPGHARVPYAFKTHALHAAIDAGARTPLWLDASCWVIKDLTPIFEHAEEHGAAVWDCGFMLGEWCHDRGLDRLMLTRDEAMRIPLIIGGCVCICVDHPAGRELLDFWHQHATDGVSFVGPWDNDGSCSKDPRCKGHRHDMPSLSEGVNRLRIPVLQRPKWFDYWSETPAEETAILARGM